MDNEARAQFRLEPSGLWRHNVASVGNVDDLFHGNGIECESNLHFAVVHATFQLAEATDTANEVDALVGAEVLDAEDGVQDMVGKDLDIQNSDRIVVVIFASLGGHLVPMTIEVHAVFVQLGGFVDLGTHIFNNVSVAQFGEELLLGQTVEVLYYAVVVNDVELVVGEDNGHEVVVLFLASVSGVVLFFLLSNESGGSAAVVTVGDVHCGNLLVEDFNEFVDEFAIIDNPEAMAEAVFLGYEVVDGLVGGYAGNDFVDAGDGGISEEYGLNVCVGDADVTHTVFFLVFAGKLMLFDDLVDVDADLATVEGVDEFCERTSLVNVHLEVEDGGVLAKFDADSEILDEELDFTFEDFELKESFQGLSGM